MCSSNANREFRQGLRFDWSKDSARRTSALIKLIRKGATRAVKKLYVGNLAWAVTDEDLQSLFSEHGSVASAAVITDRETGRSRGFGFVELEDGAEAAIEALNGHDFKGRALRVNEAQSKERSGGGGRPGGGGGGGRRF
ncbi:MAG: RNA-binding protein [Proteobacteria bacterium]|nr:RNA-binding protein [Pseudomonadota bacterium]